jgi:acetolactate decarboxylase
MKIIRVCIGLYIAVIAGCTSKQAQLIPDQSLYQVSTIDALLQGDYDGYFTLKELSAKGDFGIGTVNGLDGELVIEDGQFYQVKADGKVYKPSADMKTPFASITHFLPEDSLVVQNLNFDRFKLLVDSLMRSKNYFFAIQMEGEFELVHTRSVPAQQKPYPPLVVVTQNQPEFNLTETHGKLTGFFCPEFVKGINITGYHLHYLSDDKSSGGHLLDFRLKSGKLKLDRIQNFEMKLPNSGSFQKTEYKTDRSDELKKVEG